MLTADCVLFWRGQVLLVQRKYAPFAGMLALPGGFVEQGETTQQAAARELEEETGVRFPWSALRYVGCWNGPGRDPRGHVESHCWTGLCHTPTAPVVQAADDADAARWTPLADVTQLAFDHNALLLAATRPPR